MISSVSVWVSIRNGGSKLLIPFRGSSGLPNREVMNTACSSGADEGFGKEWGH